jgi:hypothetical protein
MRLGRQRGGAAVGETQTEPFQLSFNGALRAAFQGARVTSDGGLLVVLELDERLGLGALGERQLIDSRQNKNVQLPLSNLLRQSIYSRLAGYEDVNDAERLAQDPAFRLIGSSKIWERGAALSSRLQSFETEVLTQPVGRPSDKPIVRYKSFLYQAARWKAVVCLKSGFGWAGVGCSRRRNDGTVPFRPPAPAKNP